MRELQEDAFLADPHLGLFAVADGMGAMAPCRHAPELVLETLAQHVRHPLSETPREALDAAVRAANDALFARTEAAARDYHDRSHGSGAPRDHAIARWMGVGTTIVALLFAAERTRAFVAHVGDSRAYRLRDWTLEPLTVDHRLRDEARRAGMDEAEITALPDKIIVAAIGMSATPPVVVTPVDVAPGDLFVLCSDGLSDALAHEEIERILVASLDDLDAAARALVERAVAPADPSTAPDNVTVLLVRQAA